VRDAAQGNKEALGEFFDQRLDELLDDGSEYPVFLVTIGEKKAAVTMNVSKEQIEILKELCSRFDLSYRIGEGRKSKPSKTTGEKTERKQRAFFVSNDESYFEVLEEGRFYGFSDRSVGKLLGFPEKSVRFFVENEQPAMKSRKTISKMREDGTFGEDLKYLNLVTFIPSPDRKEIEKAIEKGRHRREKLEEFDEKTGLELGKKFIEQRTSRNLYR